jgi:twinkle protein
MTLGTGRYYLLDHWGSTHEENLLSRVRYMAKGLDCKWIFLDHLSIVVSDQEQGDERKAIDSIMTKLRQLVQETGIGLFLVSHLRRPSGGKGHEDGARVSLADLRGSAAIAQLSDMVIGLERNQQHKDEEVRNTTTVRVLKNRFAGLTGPACYLYYDKDSGRITETNCPVTDDDESEF